MKYFLIRIGLSVLGIFLIISPVKSQTIIKDGTTETTITEIRTENGIRIKIDDGNQRGSNLFHSFEKFSIENETIEAFFNNHYSVKNIFNRVTGGSMSNINGTIRANGTANVFLLNPNGIIFGQNATLNIGGSFIGTTADSIIFPDGEFTALDRNNPPLITINAPIGLNLRDNPQAIEVNGLNFDLTPDNFFTQGVTLVGGNIKINTGGFLNAFGGTVQLGGLQKEGEITFNLDNDNKPNLSFTNDLIKADVLIESSTITVQSGGGGDIKIDAHNVTLENAALLAGINFTFDPPDRAGNIIINADDTVSINGANLENRNRDTNEIQPFFSGISNNINRDFQGNINEGNGGNIEINTSKLEITNGGRIIAFNDGIGDLGNITINATDNVVIKGIADINQTRTRNDNDFVIENGFSAIFNTIGENAIGKGGDIEIDTTNLEVSEGGQIITNNFRGTGEVGNVIITAKGLVDIRGVAANQQSRTLITSLVNEGGEGNAGNIIIKESSPEDSLTVNITDGATITTATFGIGDPGNVEIEANKVNILGQAITFNPLPEPNEDTQIKLFPSAILSRIEQGAFQENQDTGKITITTNSLYLENGGFISSDTLGTGKAGDITVNTNSLSLEGTTDNFQFPSGLSSRVEDTGIGNGGNININANNIEVKNGAQIRTGTEGKGNAGNITISGREENTKTENIVFDGIRISDFTVINRNPIFQDSGNMEQPIFRIENDRVIIPNTIESSVGENAMGDGGNIEIKIDDSLILRGNSLISVASQENRTAGKIDIDADFIIALPTNNDILANARRGQGGNIEINAEKGILGIFERDPISNSTNDINATGEESNLDGTVTINVPDVGIPQDLATLDTNIIDRQTTLSESCRIDRDSEEKQNSLTINKLSGKPYNPDEPIAEDDIITVPDNSDLINSQQNYEPIVINNIVLARGMVQNPDGSISLVAYPTSNTNNSRTPNNSPNCHPQNNQ